MRLPKFLYEEPSTIEEASSILLEKPAAKILAGGTDLLVNMKHRVEEPTVVINIKRIPGLNYIAQENGAIRIGALTSLKTISGSALIAEKLPALAMAASSVGSYHHQTMGTLGGNLCQQNRCKYFNQSRWWRSARPLCFKAGGEICHVMKRKEVCHASYCGDVAPALLALDARVRLGSKTGDRQVFLNDLFSGEGKNPLLREKHEILIEVIIPEEASLGLSSYIKFANRESIDFPIVGGAFWTSPETKACRVAFTAVERKPVRGEKVESFLNGKEISREIMEEAMILASKAAVPVRNSIYDPAYKRTVMKLLLQQLVKQTTGRRVS